MNAREYAERHGQWVVERNMRGVGGDFASQELLQGFVAQGKMPPRPTTKAEILRDEPDGEGNIFEIKYSNDAEAQTIRTRWEQQGEDWKIVEVQGL